MSSGDSNEERSDRSGKQQEPDPVPEIHHGPPARKEPHKWPLHEHSGHGGHLHVHTNVLRQTGAAMRGPDMYELNDALRTLQHAAPDLGSLSEWSTGSGFTGNVTAAREGFSTAAGDAGQVNGSAAKKLMDTADDYDEVEATNTRAAHRQSKHTGHHGAQR